MEQQPAAIVYALRVDVTVPIVDGTPDYSPEEIVNRVDAALRYVPGDCEVQFKNSSTVDE